MKKIKQVVFLSLASLTLSVAFADSSLETPIGYWKTIDDVTGQTKSIVHISQDNNSLSGTVTKLFIDQDKRCTECLGDKKNKPILGMIVMENLTQNKEVPHEWVNGQILDPKNGKIYHCNIQTIENGKKLLLRGYIGLPLFGRSQTWVRDEQMS